MQDDGTACVTDNVARAPPARTVTVPERAEVEVFSDTATVSVPPLGPVDGATESQAWFDDADQDD